MCVGVLSHPHRASNAAMSRWRMFSLRLSAQVKWSVKWPLTLLPVSSFRASSHSNHFFHKTANFCCSSFVHLQDKNLQNVIFLRLRLHDKVYVLFTFWFQTWLLHFQAHSVMRKSTQEHWCSTVGVACMCVTFGCVAVESCITHRSCRSVGTRIYSVSLWYECGLFLESIQVFL